MHFYACPYCDPCEKARLEIVKVEDLKCKYDKEDTCEEIHKCKEILKCKVCKNEFKPSKLFLREQKRKIKDG